MIANNDMNRWCALYTAPRSERKLMQRLNEAGYAAILSYANRIQEMEWQDKGDIHSIVSRFPFCRRNS